MFTGSYNFTYRSVRVNDETWLQVNDPGVHDQFTANFLDVRNAAHTCWQTSKAEGCDGGRAVDTDPPAPLNCHETADKYQGAGNIYLYGTDYCDGANGAKDDSGADSDYGDGAGQVKDFDNKAHSIVNTTAKTAKFYNYPNYNAGHPEGDSFCVRPGHWVNRHGAVRRQRRQLAEQHQLAPTRRRPERSATAGSAATTSPTGNRGSDTCPLWTNDRLPWSGWPAGSPARPDRTSCGTC